MLHRNTFRLLRNVFVAAGHADADAAVDSYPSPGEGAAGAAAAGEPAAEELELAAFLLQRRSLEPLAAALQRHIDDEGVAAQAPTPCPYPYPNPYPYPCPYPYPYPYP